MLKDRQLDRQIDSSNNKREESREIDRWVVAGLQWIFFRVKTEESMCRAIRSFGMGAIEEAQVHKYKTVSKTFNAK